MKKSRSLLVALLTTTGLLFTGCVAAIGNRQPPPPNVTLGQQLIELQKAKESGAITEAEYNAQRKTFLGDK